VIVGMTRAVAIARRVLDGIVEHARAEAPNECCGLLIGPAEAGIGGSSSTPRRSITEHARCTNVHASPVRYQVDPAEHIAIIRRLRGTTNGVVGAYHSHPASPAEPSASDLREAHYPDYIWIIVSLSGDAPDTRAYQLSDGNFRPVALVPVA
jgi:proteasome lid subunit RPN8/RPN11